LGLFIVRKADFAHYLSKVRPMQLRDNISSAGVDPNFPAMNIGASKGRGFDHVVILPTKPMRDWLKNSDTQLKPQSRAKFYVALTRARHSVAVAMNWNDQPLPEGFALYERGD
jgi:superfamily I DNA/RNA helicase